MAQVSGARPILLVIKPRGGGGNGRPHTVIQGATGHKAQERWRQG